MDAARPDLQQRSAPRTARGGEPAAPAQSYDARVQPSGSLWERARDTLQRGAAAASNRLAAFAYTAPAVAGTARGGASYFIQKDRAAQELAESKEARYGRLTYGAGPAPARYSTYPATGLDPGRVYSIFVQAELSGLCWSKADMTLQILRRDSHLATVDHSMRCRVAGADWRIKPFDDSELAKATARYVRAWWDNIDSLDGALYGLLLANADGYGVRETIDRWTKVRFLGAEGKSVTVWGDHPRQLDFVHNKHINFDPTTDEPICDMGHGKRIGLPRGKMVFHAAIGDGIIETRGHIQATAYLHTISHNAVTRWAIFLAQFGLPQIAYVVDRQAYQDLERRTQYERFVANLGNGDPAVMTNEGELKVFSPTMSGNATGVHASLVGWANNEKSKRVQGEQLTTEVGGNGAGYNTSETQAQVQDAWVRLQGRGLAQDLRSDLVIPYLRKNAAALQAALGAPIDEIIAVAPRLIPHTQRPLSPAVWASVLAQARNELGLGVDEEEARELIGLNPARPGKELPGRPVVVGKDAAAVPADQVQDGGVTNTAPDTAAKAQEPPQDAASAFGAQHQGEDPGVMVALRLPQDVAAALAVPGGEPAEDLHLTLAYLGRRSAVATPLAQLAEVLRAQLLDTGPLAGQLGGIGRFPASASSEQRDVFYAPVDVPGLVELRQAVLLALGTIGIAPRQSHGFTPHITLAYLEPGAPLPRDQIAPVAVRFTALWLCCGAQQIQIPLSDEDTDDRSR